MYINKTEAPTYSEQKGKGRSRVQTSRYMLSPIYRLYKKRHTNVREHIEFLVLMCQERSPGAKE